MEKNVVIDESLLDKYFDALQLPRMADKEIPISILAAFAMQVFSEENYQGYLIARQSFSGQKELLQTGTKIISAEMIKEVHKSNRIYKTMRAAVSDPDHPEKSLQVETVLIKPEKETNNVGTQIKVADLKRHKAVQNGTCLRMIKVTGSQIADYCRLTGDSNRVHQGKNPIVPGMLLLLFTETMIRSEQLGNKDWHQAKVQYLHPLYAFQEMNVCLGTKGIEGWTNQNKIFTITFTGGIEHE